MESARASGDGGEEGVIAVDVIEALVVVVAVVVVDSSWQRRRGSRQAS